MKVTEGLESRALQNILVNLAGDGAPFFTLGCDLGKHEDRDNDPTNPYVAGGYLQIVDSDYSNRSPDDYLILAKILAGELETHSSDHTWLVRFIHTLVMFNLDGFHNIIPSLWIWFYAAASSSVLALESREALIERLQQALLNARA